MTVGLSFGSLTQFYDNWRPDMAVLNFGMTIRPFNRKRTAGWIGPKRHFNRIS